MHENDKDMGGQMRTGGNRLASVGLRTVLSVGLVASLACSGDSDTPAEDAGATDRCDLAFNNTAFNEAAPTAHHHEAHDMTGSVDFTLEEWAEVFAPADMTPAEVVQDVEANDIYRRHILAGVLTHRLGPDPWVPMTDEAACDKLSGELDQTREAAARYPTVADARAAGYTQGDTYYAGLGVHYQDFDHLGFDPAQPAQLLYDGTDDTSRLVGISYVVAREDDTPPEGFTGPNDQWHKHKTWCLDSGNGNINLAADILTEPECADLGGTLIANPGWWMLHTWIVPGYENDWGVFAGANPRLSYRSEDGPAPAQ